MVVIFVVDVVLVVYVVLVVNIVVGTHFQPFWNFQGSHRRKN